VPVRKESEAAPFEAGIRAYRSVPLICKTALLNEGGTLASQSDERRGLWGIRLFSFGGMFESSPGIGASVSGADHGSGAGIHFQGQLTSPVFFAL
jgi:hypothetical protein